MFLKGLGFYLYQISQTGISIWCSSPSNVSAEIQNTVHLSKLAEFISMTVTAFA